LVSLIQSVSTGSLDALCPAIYVSDDFFFTAK